MHTETSSSTSPVKATLHPKLKAIKSKGISRTGAALFALILAPYGIYEFIDCTNRVKPQTRERALLSIYAPESDGAIKCDCNESCRQMSRTFRSDRVCQVQVATVATRTGTISMRESIGYEEEAPQAARGDDQSSHAQAIALGGVYGSDTTSAVTVAKRAQHPS